MRISYQSRYAVHPDDFKKYDTDKIAREFLITELFKPDEIHLSYLHYDRFICGGIEPVHQTLKLDTIDPLKADFFMERREAGIINVGHTGEVSVDGTKYTLHHKEALYISKGSQEVRFSSVNAMRPARFYLNSAPAHRACKTVKISSDMSVTVEAGDASSCNARSIIKLIDSSIVEVCQLQMGITDLKSGNVWNTMPCHTHDRRMEVYFYFDLDQSDVVCHFLGQPRETRHIWVHDHQAVISPPWSIHSGSGTGNYSFVWGMAGENLDYTDMDFCKPTDLR